VSLAFSPSVSIAVSHSVSLFLTAYVPHSISHSPSLTLSISLTLSLALGLSQTLSGSSQTVVQQVLSVFTPAVVAAAAVAFQWGDKRVEFGATTTTTTTKTKTTITQTTNDREEKNNVFDADGVDLDCGYKTYATDYYYTFGYNFYNIFVYHNIHYILTRCGSNVYHRFPPTL